MSYNIGYENNLTMNGIYGTSDYNFGATMPDDSWYFNNGGVASVEDINPVFYGGNPNNYSYFIVIFLILFIIMYIIHKICNKKDDNNSNNFYKIDFPYLT